MKILVLSLYVLHLLCWLLFLAGCSSTGKQWGEPLATDQQHRFISDFTQMTRRDNACPATMITDLAITYTSPLTKRSINGFLQFSLPDNYKFVVTNPLGQIFWAVAGNRKQYQTINTAERLYHSGELQSLILKHQLPLFLTQNNWGEWLLARNRFSKEKIVDIRHDKDNRGIWFTVKTSVLKGEYEHLLIEPDLQVLLQRIIVDRSGEELATIIYDRTNTKIDKDQCIQPEHITITGLAYNSSVELWLSAIEFQSEKKSYNLPAPPHYRHIFLPRDTVGAQQ